MCLSHFDAGQQVVIEYVAISGCHADDHGNIGPEAGVEADFPTEGAYRSFLATDDGNRCGEFGVNRQEVCAWVTLHRAAQVLNGGNGAGDNIWMHTPEDAVDVDIPIVPSRRVADQLVGFQKAAEAALVTGSNERAVRNWFSAQNGPSGENLIDLIRHSDEVLETVLLMAGRTDLAKAKKLGDTRRKLQEMLTLLDEIEGRSP